jgi:hypothetical protein
LIRKIDTSEKIKGAPKQTTSQRKYSAVKRTPRQTQLFEEAKLQAELRLRQMAEEEFVILSEAR